MEKKKVKILTIIIVVLTAIIIALVGIGYAWITTTVAGEKEYIIKAGVLDLILDETSEGLLLEDEVPVEDKVGLASSGATFSVRNNGRNDACYQLYLDDIELEETETRVEDRFIKYSLEKNGKTGVAKTLTSSGQAPNRIIDEEELRGGDTNTYTLRLWFTAEENGDFGGQVFKGRLRVEAVQCIIPESPVMKTYNVYSADDYHADAYKSKITSVVTKTDLNIPETALAVTNGKGNYWDVSAAGNGSVIAYIEDDGSGKGTYKLTIGGHKGVIANSTEHMFFDFSNLVSVDLNHLDTTNLTNMSYMFRNCKKLTSVNVRSFDTSKVTDMTNMFSGCSALEVLDLRSFTTLNSVQVNGMFGACTSLKEVIVSEKWKLDEGKTNQSLIKENNRTITVVYDN